MSQIPNCRIEGPYNEKNLRGSRADALIGFDMAVEEISLLFENLEVYPEAEMILDPDIAVVNKDKVQILRDAMMDWMEMQRNEMIVSFIDSQDDDGKSEENKE